MQPEFRVSIYVEIRRIAFLLLELLNSTTRYRCSKDKRHQFLNKIELTLGGQQHCSFVLRFHVVAEYGCLSSQKARRQKAFFFNFEKEEKEKKEALEEELRN
jgi:hypothetical protein